jgi:hypothetical protein
MSSYCEPAWHDSGGRAEARIDADYLIRGIDGEGKRDPDPMANDTFACCRDHLSAAVDEILTRYPRALVRSERS